MDGGAVLDPTTGRLQYANAGHNLPIRCWKGATTKLRATGMPLGLMPESEYEAQQTRLRPGESLFLYSDGLVEAHNASREMFGDQRLSRLVGDPADGAVTIRRLLNALEEFTGPGWEQEDDVTMVVIDRQGPDGGFNPS